MANSWYLAGLEALVLGDIDLINHNIVLRGCSSGYTPTLDSDDAADDIGANWVTAESAAFTGKTLTSRRFDCNDVTIPDPGAGNTTNALIIYRDAGGAASGDWLIAYIDTIGSDLPLTHDGNDDTLVISSSPQGLLRLGPASGGSTGFYMEFLKKILDGTVYAGADTITDGMGVVGLKSSYTASLIDGGHSTLTDVDAAHECTDHASIGSLTFGNVGLAVMDGADVDPLVNDASGTLTHLLIYHWFASATFNPASSGTNRGNAHLCALIDVTDLAMDSNDDKIVWDAAGIWKLDN